MRAAVLARRAAAAAVRPQGIGAALAAALLPWLLRAVGSERPMVAGYWPLRDEADSLPALEALHAAGFPLALPVVAGRAQALRFRRWAPGAPLDPGPWGTAHPPATAPEAVPALLLVPLVAFDRRGGRVGYGGGFYDRTLAALDRAGQPARLAVGLAWAVQEVAVAPLAAHDRCLDVVVTEQEVILCRPPAG